MFAKINFTCIWLLVCLLYTNNSFSQQRVLIQTRQNLSEIQIINTTSGKVSVIKAINKEGNLFYLEAANITDLSIHTAMPIDIHAVHLNKNKSGKWISLQQNENINLYLCTSKNPHKMPLWYRLSGKLSAGLVFTDATSKPDANEQFFASKQFEFLTPEEFYIKWPSNFKADSINISLEGKFIWKSNNYINNQIVYSAIKNSLNQNFEPSKNYSLTVFGTNLTDNSKNSFNTKFKFNTLVFRTKNPAYFIVNDSIEINWKTDQLIKRIYIRDIKDKKIIWEKDTFSYNTLNYNTIKCEMGTSLESRKKYELVIELASSNNKLEQHILSFEVLLAKSEFFEIMEFLNKED